MSFKANVYQQLSIIDSFSGLTAIEKKALEQSWAKVFADALFPAIDEKRFAVRYSDQESRPNTRKPSIMSTTNHKTPHCCRA